MMVPFNIYCDSCFFCVRGLYSNCHNVNPNATAVGGIYGYSHTCGGYDGGQAEYVRVPFADVGPSLIPEWMDDEDAVLLTDALATGYFGAQLGDIAEGDVVAVFGAGPVGLFAAKSAWFMGAGRVIVIDHLDYRLEKARSFAHAETYNFTEYDDIVVHLKKITDHLGSDVAIDAAGAEADGNLMQHISSAKLKLQGGSPIVLNWAIAQVLYSADLGLDVDRFREDLRRHVGADRLRDGRSQNRAERRAVRPEKGEEKPLAYDEEEKRGVCTPDRLSAAGAANRQQV